jgi:type I site-specific restriction-modification system R (restriction) subunit
LQELISMPHAYSEDQLVEQPAIGLFAELGWQTVAAMEEVFGSGGTLGRETSGEVVLVSRLRAALARLNPVLPPEGFVNGLPLVVIELKKPGVPARAAFDENLTSYKHPQNGIPALFVFNGLLIASNGTDSR